MEHLAAPKGTRPIDIPYLRTRDPYRGPFLDYPMRVGWKVQPDGELDFPWNNRVDGGEKNNNEKQNKIDAFIQTWLFFGCLIEVFGIVGIKVKESDFIREGKFITTAKLPELIEQWKDREDLPGEASGEGRSGRYKSIMKVLERVQFYEKYCNDANTDEYGPNVSAWSVEPAISLSIMALGWALKSAAYNVYGPNTRPPRQQWGYSSILDDRMRDGGWCWGERAKLRSDVEIDGVFYFASLQSPRRDQDHRGCFSVGCSGKGVDESQYKTKHAKHGCTCEDVMVPDTVIETIKNGGIPLISWTQQSGLTVVKYDAHSKQEYVAISHVWSDGMGNPNENALPKCQLSCLQEMVNVLYAQQYGDGNDRLDRPVGFWMDTLCIPVHRDHAQYRKQTIRQMANIYKSAVLVLVLDSWIRELPRSANIIEKVARLYLSNWQHRLWTLQEGVLAQDLFFQFSDGPQALRHLWQEHEIDKKSCPGFYSTIVDSTLPLVPMSHAKLKTEGEQSTLEEKFPVLVEVIVNRKTSKLADETVCFATLLGLDPGFLLSEDESKRMETFLRKVGTFQQGLIFNELRRLHTDGFRWAPRSFLSQAKSLWPKLSAELSKRDRDNFLVHGVLRYRGGLLVRFPGIKLLCRGSHLKRMMALVPRHDGTVRYGALLVEEDDDVNPSIKKRLSRWDPACQYAIVSSTPVCRDGGETMCIFGMLRGQDDEGVLAIEYLCRAVVKPLSNVKHGRTTQVLATISKYGTLFEGDAEEYGEDCLIAADWLAEDQEWCVM